MPPGSPFLVSIESLYRRYSKLVQQRIRSIVNDNEVAEELTQDVFIRISGSAALERIEHPRSFLLKIGTNLALDHLRERRRCPESESDEVLLNIGDERPDLPTALHRQRQVERLQQAIVALPPRAREALTLHKLQGLKLREVADELGISQTMVEKHIKNALLKCRAALQQDIE